MIPNHVLPQSLLFANKCVTYPYKPVGLSGGAPHLLARLDKK